MAESHQSWAHQPINNTTANTSDGAANVNSHQASPLKSAPNSEFDTMVPPAEVFNQPVCNPQLQAWVLDETMASSTLNHEEAEQFKPVSAMSTRQAVADDRLANSVSSMVLSSPELNRQVTLTVPPKQLMPHPNNPFYASKMTLTIAAENMAAYFKEAAAWLSHGDFSTPPAELVALSRKPNSTLNRIFANIAFTAEFLEMQHARWNLLELPDGFFAYVLPKVELTAEKLQRMTGWKGCAAIMNRAWKDAMSTGRMLIVIQAAKAKTAEGQQIRVQG